MYAYSTYIVASIVSFITYKGYNIFTDVSTANNYKNSLNGIRFSYVEIGRVTNMMKLELTINGFIDKENIIKFRDHAINFEKKINNSWTSWIGDEDKPYFNKELRHTFEESLKLIEELYLRKLEDFEKEKEHVCSANSCSNYTRVYESDAPPEKKEQVIELFGRMIEHYDDVIKAIDDTLSNAYAYATAKKYELAKEAIVGLICIGVVLYAPTLASKALDHIQTIVKENSPIIKDAAKYIKIVIN